MVLIRFDSEDQFVSMPAELVHRFARGIFLMLTYVRVQMTFWVFVQSLLFLVFWHLGNHWVVHFGIGLARFVHPPLLSCSSGGLPPSSARDTGHLACILRKRRLESEDGEKPRPWRIRLGERAKGRLAAVGVLASCLLACSISPFAACLRLPAPACACLSVCPLPACLLARLLAGWLACLLACLLAGFACLLLC